MALLQSGSRGSAVVALQKRLGVAADGIFGPKTRAALIAQQKKLGVTADGIYGPKTEAAWAKATTPEPVAKPVTPKPVTPVTPAPVTPAPVTPAPTPLQQPPYVPVEVPKALTPVTTVPAAPAPSPQPLASIVPTTPTTTVAPTVPTFKPMALDAPAPAIPSLADNVMNSGVPPVPTDTAPTTADNALGWKPTGIPDAPTAFSSTVLDPYAEAQKSAQLQYDQKARSIADYIKGQTQGAQMASDLSGGVARSQANDQGLLSSTAAQKIVADYSARAAQPYMANIDSAQSDLNNLGTDTANNAAINYQNLYRNADATNTANSQWQYNAGTNAANTANALSRTDAATQMADQQWNYTAQQEAAKYQDALSRSDAGTAEDNARWRLTYNDGIKKYQDATARGDLATALDIWKTLMSFGMGKGAVTGNAKDYTAPTMTPVIQDASKGIVAGTGPVGDPPRKNVNISTLMAPMFSSGTQTLVQKQMAQNSSQFAQQLALERDKYNTAKAQYDAANAPTDPYSSIADILANPKQIEGIPAATLLSLFKMKYGVDPRADARNGDPRAKAVMDALGIPDWSNLSAMPLPAAPAAITAPFTGLGTAVHGLESGTRAVGKGLLDFFTRGW